MEAHFTVLSGPFRGQTFPIPRGKFILGREHDCHLVLGTNSVSRHHCVLLMDDFTLRIRDLASKNGTFINRDLTRVGERILAHGDRVRLGDLVIRVELESSAASLSAASLETQDVDRETIDHAGDSPERPKGDQPTSTEAPQAQGFRDGTKLDAFVQGRVSCAPTNTGQAIGEFIRVIVSTDVKARRVHPRVV